MKKLRPLLFVAACLIAAHVLFRIRRIHLSDPQKSKADDRLTGVWRFRGDSGEMDLLPHRSCWGEAPGVRHASHHLSST